VRRLAVTDRGGSACARDERRRVRDERRSVALGLPASWRQDVPMSATPPPHIPHIERRTLKLAFAGFACVTCAFLVVNAFSVADEGARAGAPGSLAKAFLLEATSVAAILALFVPVALFERRVPVSFERWPLALTGHLVASLVFSAAHIAAMMALRFWLWPLVFEGGYSAFGDPLADGLYEYRKDLLTYALMIGVIMAVRERESVRERLAAAHADARTDHIVTLRCGGRELRLPAREIVSVSAAGNYVEVRTLTGVHLARATLSGLEALLGEAGADPVRVHRSHLAARPAIREIVPGSDGDAQARLADGSVLPVSRRYRALL
jgi:hypothetical protein